MQTTVTQIELREIRGPKPEHVDVTLDNAGEVRALCWLYETSDRGLYRMAKSRGGIWDRDAGGWTFSSPEIARSLLDAIAARHPDWPILGLGEIKWLAGASIARRVLGKLGYCVFPLGLPYFSRLAEREVKIYKISRGTQKIGVAVGDEVQIEAFAEMLLGQGAGEEEAILEEWGFHGQNSPLQIATAGWAVEIRCDLGNPAHYLLHKQAYEWVGSWPNGVRTATPWGGVINKTRRDWSRIEEQLQSAGLEWQGDNPAQEIATPATLGLERIPGWNAPTRAGQQLHQYQREGVEFCARRGMRALIGDEMGVGKTAQAIAAAEGTGAQRVVIVCPANARYVWEREIQSWGQGGGIQHITSQLDILDEAARWHVVTHDLLAARVETWRFLDEQEKQAFVSAFPERAEDVKQDKVKLELATATVPVFANPKRIAAWEKVMLRLRGELLEQLAAAGGLLIVDEAHRGKNKNAKRSKALARLAASGGGVLLLTGTPLRNHAGEAARLLGYLDPQATVDLDKERGYTIQDVQDYLSYFMIRRTKVEVLPELPEKTRQRVDLDRLDHDEVERYHQHLQYARRCYEDAINKGAGESAARQAAQGGIELARSALGLAKVRGGAVAELVAGVVEDRECCVVFSAHHQVSDELQHQLQEVGIETAVIDGRTDQQERARIVQEFQEGRLQVLVGGINAAGESITLTRADTVVFTELDWVPAALLQAEDRIHRVGQKNACQIIHAVAKLAAGENLDELMIGVLGAKLSTIGQILGEDGDNIVAGAGIRAEILRQLLKVGAGQLVAA